jgi:hypothetical protein
MARKKSELDTEIERAYYAHAKGTMIDILDIPKVFEAARAAHAAGWSVEKSVVASITKYGQRA